MSGAAEMPLVVLTAGGTGGHVFPAEALASTLLERGYRLALITDRRGKGYSGVLGGLETFGVSAGQMLGRGLWGKVTSSLSLMRGVVQARALLKRLRPAVVVGFGGYASVPAVVAAQQLGVPVVLHEQNAVLGRANRLFAGKASVIATSFAHVSHLPPSVPVVRTGMPVRMPILAASATPYALSGHGPSGRCDLHLVVLGGSQGAKVFSDVLPQALLALPERLRLRLRLTQQARPEDVERVQAAYADSGLRVEVRSFFDDVAARLSDCALLIARSGSSTVAETAVMGRPALFVPYPFAADDHQTANAQALEAAGGAWVVPQPEFTAEAISARLCEILGDEQTLRVAADAARAFAIPDAAARLADLVAQTAAPPATSSPL